MKTHLGKVKILQQGMAQMTGTHNNQLVVVVDAQNVADFGTQLSHIVAITLLAKFAEATEILADL